MTETNHYAAALSALDRASDCSSEDPLTANFLATAQAHATLALVDAIQDLNIDAEGTTVETTSCRCDQLVQRDRICATCGHLADLHEPDDGPCRVLAPKESS